jgi:SP family myo-inositol transporter-like MFS transporter 13
MLVLISLLGAIGGFVFGYDLGLMVSPATKHTALSPLTSLTPPPSTPHLQGGAALNIQDFFGIGEGIIELIVGAAKLGSVLGTFLGGAAMLQYGRRPAIALDAIFFLLGPIIMATASSTA